MIWLTEYGVWGEDSDWGLTFRNLSSASYKYQGYQFTWLLIDPNPENWFSYI